MPGHAYVGIKLKINNHVNEKAIREIREMKDPKIITMKNGKPATQGTCPTCGTKMFRIGKS